ncbi:phosphohistidine phosphatase [Rhodopseudomonas julia]|uniref:Phosphohistidine phosphatase n=1 Tax=Rhodopseudomonas julia TaxID=200617 RepID=A0ABU0CCK4_9BRAD|nr:histidine phosphatase family protein [Rhodopseudomonas julia]MDQ0326797.1 phosphohistidine phosphatase [Rhodopseudomonas julia]
MMPKLLLLRHAKSDWHSGARTDFERPLNARGREAAEAMGAFMAAEGLAPDLVLCSPSKRTRETLELVSKSLQLPDDVRFPETLYEEDGSDYQAVLRNEAGEAECCLVVGHNPMTYEAALSLAGDGASHDMARLAVKYPSGTLSVLEFDAPWAELKTGSGRLTGYVRPADLTS